VPVKQQPAPPPDPAAADVQTLVDDGVIPAPPVPSPDPPADDPPDGPIA
jgi:hypothetical protein